MTEAWERFNGDTYESLLQRIGKLGLFDIPLSKNTDLLTEKFTADTFELKNKMAIQPMEGCDSKQDGKPGELTQRRYDRFAESGAALIWMEAVAITKEGRGNPGQLLINDDNADSFKALTERIKETAFKEHGFAPKIIMQATHSGRYAKPRGVPAPVIAYNNPLFEQDGRIDKSRIISDDALRALEERFGTAAKLARDAGFDGIDIKCCHRYLLSELLSAYTRSGEYGGCFENRIRLLLNAMKNAKAMTDRRFIVTTRLNVYDGFEYPYGFGVNKDGGLKEDFSEPLELIDILHNELGINLINITIGNPYVNPHVNRPSDHATNGAENPLVGVNRMYRCVGKVQKVFPGLAVVGSGVSYLRQHAANLAAGAIEKGYAAIQGFGRESLAYPEFAKDIAQSGRMDPRKCCVACGKCSELMRAGSVTGCVVRDREIYLPLYKRYCG